MVKQKNPEVTLNRRAKDDRRGSADRRKDELPVGMERRVSERRKVPRRRQIDPTTCERDYSDEEIEFMHALDAYKRANGRMFPTCSEILEVIRGLGYTKTISIPAPATETECDLAATAEPVLPSIEGLPPSTCEAITPN